MRYDIVLAPEAVEDLSRLHSSRRAEVRDALETHLRHRPDQISKARIKRLRGLSHPQFRLRVGEIRVFYDIEDNSVQVLAVVPKSEAAAWLETWGESDETYTTD